MYTRTKQIQPAGSSEYDFVLYTNSLRSKKDTLVPKQQREPKLFGKSNCVLQLHNTDERVL